MPLDRGPGESPRHPVSLQGHSAPSAGAELGSLEIQASDTLTAAPSAKAG